MNAPIALNKLNLWNIKSSPARASRPMACFGKSAMKIASFSLTALLLTLGLTLSSVSDARNGNESHGGGTERSKRPASAWFLQQNRVINACAIIDPKFQFSPQENGPQALLTKPEAEALIRAAFQKWVHYIDERGVFNHSWDKIAPRPSEKLRLVEKCEKNTDLRVYFGATDQRVEYVRRSYKDPYAMAGSYGQESFLWKKGLIWVAAQTAIEKNFVWTSRRLEAILIHEIGHAFGNGHVPGTIMAENFGDRLSDPYGAEKLTDIDQLLVLFQGSAKQTLRIENGIYESFDPIFLRLIGRKASEKASLTMEVRGDEGSFILADDQGTQTFSLSLKDALSCTNQGQYIFYREEEKGGFTYAASKACVQLGMLRDTEGSVAIPIIARKNAYVSRYEIATAEQGEKSENLQLFFYYNGRPWNSSSFEK